MREREISKPTSQNRTETDKEAATIEKIFLEEKVKFKWLVDVLGVRIELIDPEPNEFDWKILDQTTKAVRIENNLLGHSVKIIELSQEKQLKIRKAIDRVIQNLKKHNLKYNFDECTTSFINNLKL